MEESSIHVKKSDACICSANVRFRCFRGPGEQLEKAHDSLARSSNGGSAFTVPYGFPRYMPKAVHVDEPKTAEGAAEYMCDWYSYIPSGA